MLSLSRQTVNALLQGLEQTTGGLCERWRTHLDFGRLLKMRASIQ